MEYHTDEEELAKETMWKVVEHRRQNKKRKATTSPEVSPQQKNPTAITKPTVTNEQDEKKPSRPPPINVIGVKKYEDLITQIKKSGIETFKVTLMNGIHKVNVFKDEDLRELTN